MSKQSELADTKKQIQKTLITLKECMVEFENLQTSSRTRMKSLTNLTEQLQCCIRVKNVDIPVLKEFPDLRDKLICKLTNDITQCLQELNTSVQQFTECSENLTKQFDYSLMKFNKLNTCEKLPSLTKSSAICPSISDMMEMIQISESRMRESCLCKTYILEEFTPETYDEPDMFKNEWFLGDKEILDLVQDCVTVTSFFMEEKIT